MKWFKHQTDASDDIKIKRLEDKFGITGYGIFFKIVEKVGKEGRNYALDTKKYPVDFLAKDFKVEKKVFEECLTLMRELSLVVLKNSIISIPNMKKYADDYTYKVRRKSGQGTDNVPLDKNRIDKNRKEENDGVEQVNAKDSHKLLANYYLELKGWDHQEPEFYKQNGISYPRQLAAAKEILTLTDYNLEAAKEKVAKIKAWAEGNGLEWALETVTKKWLEIDNLKV